MRIKALGSLEWLSLSPVQRQDFILQSLSCQQDRELMRIQSQKVKVKVRLDLVLLEKLIKITHFGEIEVCWML